MAPRALLLLLAFTAATCLAGPGPEDRLAAVLESIEVNVGRTGAVTPVPTTSSRPGAMTPSVAVQNIFRDSRGSNILRPF